MAHDVQPKTLPDRLRARIDDAPRQVWSPADFADIGARAAVDKALQRMVTSGQLRRIERGLYDKPSQNMLTGKSTVPDYRAVIDAIARRDQVRWLISWIMVGLSTKKSIRFLLYPIRSISSKCKEAGSSGRKLVTINVSLTLSSRSKFMHALKG